MSSRCRLAPPANPEAPVRRFGWLAVLPLLCALQACNGSGEVYRSGPWGRATDREAWLPEYPSPWNAPRTFIVSEQPAPAAVTRVTVDPMEPSGSWVSRSVSTLPEISANDPGSSLKASSGVQPPTVEMNGAAPAIVSKSTPPSVENKPHGSAKTLSSLTGRWTAQENGSSCRLLLSSTPSLDLYKASTSDCKSKALQNINSWSYREDALVLYSRGNVVLRLQGDGSAFKGKLGDQGTSVTLIR